MRRLVFCLAALFAAAPAFAQPRDPLPGAVLDLRGAFVRMKSDPVTTETLGIDAQDLATHALGIVAGLHAYPVRGRNVALGLGAELFLARATKHRLDDDKVPIGPEVRRQVQSLSGQISLNFGHRQGWSYLTAGIGPLSFDTYRVGTLPDGLRTMTQNFGFGARWFSTRHAAFMVDLRFYLTQPADGTFVVGGRERRALTVMSAGISLK